ncbi:hypothetical protein [Pseudomonas sp. A-B-19]|uniref:hypothetical protein n=1 Tax=Pseudomonas sp. A-B-19 TaxID=2832405 RepID=UPI001CBC9234|nr:hypothetical protein [Pseudomonas sp. A-B-19]
MFRSSITIRDPEDAVTELERFHIALNKSGLSETTSVFLCDQVKMALQQFKDQMALRHMHMITADRVFEGDDYRVSIAVRQGQESLLSKIIGLLKG